MKQYMRKITPTASAILIALTLFGLNTDQAIAQRKARKGAKARGRSNAKIEKTQGQVQSSMIDVLVSGAKDKSQDNRSSVSNGDGGTAIMIENPLLSNLKGKPHAKRRGARNGNGRAAYDLRKAKP